MFKKDGSMFFEKNMYEFNKQIRVFFLLKKT